MPQMKQLHLGDLKPWRPITRLHPPEQIKQLAMSIRRFGFTQPILIDENNRILAGHGRFQAASELGFTKVPCLIVDHMSETEKRAYVIADNKLALNALWNETTLAGELESLLTANPQSHIDAIGFSLGESEAAINVPSSHRT